MPVKLAEIQKTPKNGLSKFFLFSELNQMDVRLHEIREVLFCLLEALYLLRCAKDEAMLLSANATAHTPSL